MTAAPTSITDVFTSLFAKALSSPGYYATKLHRTDGIIQMNVTEKLFANHLRKNFYRFEVHSQFAEEFKKLDSIAAASGRMLPEIVRGIHNAITEYAAGLTNECEGSMKPAWKIIRKAHSCYEIMIVVAENLMPKLSAAMKESHLKISLWKYLHSEFVNYVLIPALDKVTSSFKESLVVLMAQNDADNCYESARRLFKLRDAANMLMQCSLNESLVHKIQSSEAVFGDEYAKLEEVVISAIQENTEVVMAKPKELRNMISRIMLPCSYEKIKKALEDITGSNEENMEEDQEEIDQHIKDVDVEFYCKAIGA